MIPINKIALYKHYLKYYLISQYGINNLKKAFHCLNPNHIDNNPSMYYSSRYNICKCFSCNTRYDIFDLIKLDYGLDNFKDQFNKISELFDSEIDLKEPTCDKEEEFEKDYSKYFAYCFQKSSLSNYMTTIRGINENLLLKYRIGYDEERKLIVFPINKYCYFARSTIDTAKYKSKGISHLWNEKLLEDCNENELVYITESIIDALSLETILPEIKVISLNGTANAKRLFLLAKKYNFKGAFVLSLDNDLAGETASNQLKLELDKLNILSFKNTLLSSIGDGRCKDINEALINNKEKLKSNINYFNEQYQQVLDNYNLRKDDQIELT